MNLKYSREFRELLWAEYSKGRRTRELAAEHNMNSGTVRRMMCEYRWCLANGTPLIKPRRTRKYSDQVYARLWEGHEARVPARVLADELGINKDYVYHFWEAERKRLNVPLRQRYNVEDYRTLWEARLAGTSTRELADQSGIPIKTMRERIRRYRLRFGLEKIYPSRYSRELCERVWASYYNDYATLPELANKYDIPEASIKKIVARERKRLGAPKRQRPAWSVVNRNPMQRLKYDQAFIDLIFAGWGHVSSSILAERHGLTRGTVAGIWHREKQKRGITSKARPTIEKPRPKPARRLRIASYGWPTLVTDRAPRIRVPKNEPASLSVPLLELTSKQCHWPHGEQLPYLFCGHDTAHQHTSYCPLHDALSRGGPAPVISEQEREHRKARGLRNLHSGTWSLFGRLVRLREVRA